jgi:Carboxypeptidase regulatory-like domain
MLSKRFYWLTLRSPRGTLAFLVRGQDFGSLYGAITDPSGATVSGARVTATDLASSAPHLTTTGKDGGFNLTQLPPGDYKVGSIATLDSREGVVDGIRGNQTDVTVDGSFLSLACALICWKFLHGHFP